MIVLLPTPDDPSSAAVRPAPRCARTCSKPFPTLRVHTWTTMSPASDVDVADMGRQIVGERSGLVRRMTGDGAALARHQQVPLETARVVVAIEAHDDEDDVHIGGDDLLAGRLAGRAPRERRAPRQDADDDRSILSGAGEQRPSRRPRATRRGCCARCFRRPAVTASSSPSST